MTFVGPEPTKVNGVIDARTERFKKEVGKRLRKLREDAQLSPASIEKQSIEDGDKVDRTYIYDIEKGEANWSIEHLAKILGYCHGSVESFFMGLQRSDIPVEQQAFHRMLREILDSGDPDLAFGIRINLEAISEKAGRVQKTRASPSPEPSVRKPRHA